MRRQEALPHDSVPGPGNAVSTVKHPAFVGQTVLICQPVQADGKTKRGSSFLAQDAMGAGVGDLVLCSRRKHGPSDARQRRGPVSRGGGGHRG